MRDQFHIVTLIEKKEEFAVHCYVTFKPRKWKVVYECMCKYG